MNNETENENENESEDVHEPQFDTLGLDHRLVKALLKCGFIHPTMVQSEAIPIALQKKDILMRAKTGSGKTLAFCLPLVENILRSVSSSSTTSAPHGPKAIILAPTQELIVQISTVLTQLTVFCNDVVRQLSLSQHGKFALANEKPRLLEHPHILICTPHRLVQHLTKGHVSLQGVAHIVIDEADLIITHDFEPDIKAIAHHLPCNAQRPQIVMCSATLNPNTNKLQAFFLMHHPSVIDIDGANGSGFDENRLTEYYLETPSVNDKFIVMFALLQLHVINGKSIVFVHSIDLSYRLKLFLEKFLIPTAVLNPKLPYNSRQSVIDKFNRGLFQYLITTDALNEHDEDKNNPKNKQEADGDGDADVDMDKGKDKEAQQDEYEFEGADEDNGDDDDETTDKSKADADAGDVGMAHANGLVAYRGVDFREVAAVINFSSPGSLKTYIHRVGRTARAGNYGVAITLVAPKERRRFESVLSQRVSADNTSLLQKLPLNMHDLDAFRYRCESVRCSITTQLVKNARLNELRMEILNSKRLASHFKERKREYELLRHDKMLQPAELVKPHMSVIPKYMMASTELCKQPGTLQYMQQSRGRQRHSEAVMRYKQTFGQLPPVMREQFRKQRLRQRMRDDPILKRHVLNKRAFNRRHPHKRNQSGDSTRHWEFLGKSTLLGEQEKRQHTNQRVDTRVFVKPIRGWKDPLKKKMVKTGRRKPSLRGMSKAQIKKIKKRSKLKRLGKRR
eukprot:CAMPEP_0202687736 /NCGR_PEP_ID=MMETSP1385-20130828/3372_1 /ASSEMBLY_ACC=CAM_ASM_000861 /TAXON_ID=933848 /ORGANISM="Elphidium margaritaceum" /LENGTH=735 /DNA_ID=CAMNT_0049342579 /DNA_START=49 /DNA_END=2256 /DNA_ORIENTATION=+